MSEIGLGLMIIVVFFLVWLCSADEEHEKIVKGSEAYEKKHPKKYARSQARVAKAQEQFNKTGGFK